MRRRHLQRGVALIATMALILMGGSAYLVSRLKASSANFTVANKAHNTRVLRQAKEALIGWVAAQAAKTGETNPGRLVCPEGSAYTGIDGVEGHSAPGLQSVGGVTYNASTCASIGRFPWRSIGMVQLVDATSEPLWYVVGSTWRMSSTSSYTNINSNTKGDITYGASYSATRTNGSTNVTGLTATQTAGISVGMKVGGTGIAAGTTVAAVGSTNVTLSAAATASGTSALTFGEDAVALIIAPGAALDAQAATGCTARAQGRSAPSPSINAADYLECYDATTLAFTTNGGSTASNDQVMIITAAELMPAIEAAVAARIESEVVPVLKAVYASATWGRSTANPLFPYPAAFSLSYPVNMSSGNSTLSGLTTAETATLAAGMEVSGTGIPGGATISSVGSTTVTLNTAASQTRTGSSVTFGSPGTGKYQGSTATASGGSYQGLLPFTYTAASCGSDERCTAGTSAFTRNNNSIAPTLTRVEPDPPASVTSSCSYNSSLRARCTGNFDNNNVAGNIKVRMTISVRNAAMALRTIDATKVVAEWRQSSLFSYATVTSTVSASFNADGTATLVAEATLPYTGNSAWQYRFTITNTPLADHAILSSSDPDTGWFVRNEWYRLVYYAVAPTLTAAGLPTPACTTGSTCLTLNRAVTGATNTSPIVLSVPSHGLATGEQTTVSGVAGNTAANGTWPVTVIDSNTLSLTGSNGNGTYAYGGSIARANNRALLILAGRSLSNATRHNQVLADYLEFGNVAGTGSFEQQVVTPLPKMIATDTAVATNEYNVSAYPRAGGTSLFIKAANTNTGAANLHAGGGQAREIFNLDGTSLAASTIRASAVVQVSYDGTYYFLSKKPFNDRVIVLDRN